MIKKKFFYTVFTFILAIYLCIPAFAGFAEYLDEIEVISKRTISVSQRQKLIAFYNSGQVLALNNHQLTQRHGQFTQTLKTSLRTKWKEKNPGKKWLRYKKTVNCSVNGETICRHKKWPYDMHHIIPQSHNGPHKWWNVFPLTLNQHNEVHNVGSECSTLFPNSVGARKANY